MEKNEVEWPEKGRNWTVRTQGSKRSIQIYLLTNHRLKKEKLCLIVLGGKGTFTSVRTGLRGLTFTWWRDVAVYVFDINQPSLPTPF